MESGIQRLQPGPQGSKCPRSRGIALGPWVVRLSKPREVWPVCSGDDFVEACVLGNINRGGNT